MTLLLSRTNNWLIAAVAVISIAPSCFAVDLVEEEFAPIQTDGRSCQSYALAIALHLQDNTGEFYIAGDSDSTVALEMLQRERQIRALVMKSMGKRRISYRSDWKYAVEHYTNKKYTLKTVYKTSEQSLFDFIKEHFKNGPACLPSAGKCIFKEQKASNLPLPRLLLTSLSSAEHQHYRQGHVVGIVDIKEEQEKFTLRPYIKVINSYAKNTAFSCVEKRGKVSWLSDYTPRILWKNPKTGLPLYSVSYLHSYSK